MSNKRKTQRIKYLDEINFTPNDIEFVSKDKTLQLHNAIQKAVEDKQKYAKYNIVTVDYDDKGEKYNMNLPAVKVIADSTETEANKRTLLNHGYTKKDLENPNIKAHLPTLANILHNHDLNGLNYLKGIGKVGLGLAGILTGGSGIGLVGTLGKEGIKQGAKKLGKKALRFGIDTGVGVATDYASNKVIQGISNGEYEGFGDLMNRGVFNGSKDDVWKPMLWDMVNPLGIASGIATDMLINSNLGRSLATSAMINLSPNMIRQGNIVVGNNYFHAPDKWYRYIDSPEVGTIQELGMNVTTTDGLNIPSQSNRFRTSLINNSNWEHNKTGPKLSRKLGSAHGNHTQASAKQLWNGTIAGNNDLFRHGVLEGGIPENINVGINRRVFKTTPRENVSVGDRVGFPTGKMPIEGLRYFEHIPGTKKYKYEGEVFPYKTEYVTGQNNSLYTNQVQLVPINKKLFTVGTSTATTPVIRQVQNGLDITSEVLNDLKTISFPRYAQLMTRQDYKNIDKTKLANLENQFNDALKDTKVNILDNSTFNKGDAAYFDPNTNTINLPSTSSENPLYPNTQEYHEALHALYNNSNPNLRFFMRGALGFEGKLGRPFTSKYKNNNNTVNTLLSKEELANTLSETKREVLKHPERYITNSELLKKYKTDPSDITLQNEILDNVEDYKFLTLFSRINGYGQNFIDNIDIKVKNNLINRKDVLDYFSKLKLAYKMLPVGAGAIMINNK